MLFFFFFFSSRRRHTRLQGDWSSDVCSSDLGGDAGQAAGSGCAAAPGPPGEVGDLAFDDRPVGAVALLPGRVALGSAGPLQHCLLGWMVMVRPRRELVQSGRSGQVAHQGRNDARPPPRAGTMMVVCPAGQVTVAWSRSTVKRSLANRPPLLR